MADSSLPIDIHTNKLLGMIIIIIYYYYFQSNKPKQIGLLVAVIVRKIFKKILI